MKKGVRKTISVAMIFFILIGTIGLSQPVAKVYANEMAEENSVTSEFEFDKSEGSKVFIPFPVEDSTSEALPINEGEESLKTMSAYGAEANLIENGDFNMDPSQYGSWWTNYDTSKGTAEFFWDGATYHGESGHSLQIQGDGAYAVCANSVQIQPGKEYSFSAWGKALNVSEYEYGEDYGAAIYIAQYDKAENRIDGTGYIFTANGTFDWMKADRDFTAASNADSLFILLMLSGSGTVWYDDISLIEAVPVVPVTGITLNKTSITLTEGGTEQLVAEVQPADATNRDVTWSVVEQSVNDVVTVSSTGLITAVGPGTAIVRATSVYDSTIYIDCDVTVIQPHMTTLPESAVISDSIMHPSQPVLYAVDSANSKLYAINYETKSIAETSFTLKPEKVDYSNEKLYVTLLKAPHNSYMQEEQQKGAIAVVNADNLTLIKQIDIDTDPFDVAVSGDYIFVPSGSGQWTKIKSYSEVSERLISSYSIRQQSYAEYNAALNKIYTIDTDSSPRDYEAYDIDNGIFTGSYDSPYHGDYSMDTNFRISPDGKYIFNGSGLILTCDTDSSKDMRFLLRLNKPFSDIAFDSDNGKFYTAVSGKTIYAYDYSTFAGLSTCSSEGDVAYLYYRDNMLVALSKINNSRFIVEVIDPSNGTEIGDTTVCTKQLEKDGSKYDLDYSINDAVMQPETENTVIHISDSINKKIASINYVTGEVKELTTFYSPGSIAYYDGELFVGYGNQGIIGIYDVQTLALKKNILTGATFFDLNVGNDGYIYTSSDDYTRSYSRTSGQEVSKLWVFETGYLEVHPTQNMLYMTSMYVSPSDLYALNYSAGRLTSHYDSPYHGDYFMAYNNRISPDGRYIFNGYGEVFYCAQNKAATSGGTNDNPNTDLTHAFSLNYGLHNDIVFDLQNNRFYSGNDSGITSFDYGSFLPTGYVATVGKIVRLYNLADSLLSIERNNDIYFINTIEKSAFGALPGVMPAPNNSRIPPFTVQNAENATSIEVGAVISDTYEGGNASKWYKFSPGISGSYTITSPANGGGITLYDSKGFDLAYRQSDGILTVNMEAGKLYYLRIGNFYYGGTFSFSIMQNAPITGITLNKHSAAIMVGQTEQLTATVSPDDEANKSVTWSVQSQSTNNVVTVSSTGLVTAVNPGTAIVRVRSSADSSMYADCNITVIAADVSKVSNVKALAASLKHSVALKADGSVTAWGNNEFGECDVPPGLSNAKAIAAGYYYTVALQEDGTVAAWGYNNDGQCDVPSGLTGVKAIAAGGWHTAAVRENGTVVAWGSSDHAQCNVPSGLTGVKAIAAGPYHTVALKEDGTVVVWGWNHYGQSNVPSGLTGVKAIAAGEGHTLALKEDGTVTAWGWNYYGQCNVPSGLTGVKAIAAGYGYSGALKEDGTVVVWGDNDYKQQNIPSGLNNVEMVSGGTFHILALKKDGSVVAWGDNTYNQCNIPKELLVTAVTGITLNKCAISIKTGQTEQLTATILPANATNKNVTWSVQNQSADNVITVSSGGLVTAVNSGTAVVRAVSVAVPGIDAACSVTVTPASTTTPDTPSTNNPSTTASRGSGSGGASNTTATIPPTIEMKSGIEELVAVSAEIMAAVQSNKDIILQSNTAEDISQYKVTLPAVALANTDKSYAVILKTPVAEVALPCNMLQNIALPTGSDLLKGNISVSLRRDSFESKPAVIIETSNEDKKIIWNSSSTQVRISIPYEPSSKEDADKIAAAYIDDSGNSIIIPNASYDKTAKRVNFYTNHFSKFAVVYQEKTFKDIASHWAKKDIEIMASKGIINGKGSNLFDPDGSITRADFVLMVMKAFGLSADTKNSFTDVNPEKYYHDAVAGAYALGIVNGDEKGAFSPESYISRQDLFVIMHRALKCYNKKLNLKSTNLDSYEDAASISDYAAASIKQFVAEGIVKGNNNRINPVAYASRAETAAVLKLILDKCQESL